MKKITVLAYLSTLASLIAEPVYIVDYISPAGNIWAREPDVKTSISAQWLFDDTTPLIETSRGQSTTLYGWAKTEWSVENEEYVPHLRHLSTRGIQVQVAQGQGVDTSMKAVILWMKEDFANGGKFATMRFEPESQMSVAFETIGANAREIRFVVKQGGQYYTTNVRKTSNATVENPFLVEPYNVGWRTFSADDEFTIGDEVVTGLRFTDIEAVGLYFSLSQSNNQTNLIFDQIRVSAFTDDMIDPVRVLFPEADVLDDSQYDVGWIASGIIHAHAFPWIYSFEHGWWYAGAATHMSYWFYDFELGWIHGRPSMPNIYFRPHDNTWIYHDPQTGSNGTGRSFHIFESE